MLPHHQQTDIFRDDRQQLEYSELCNALYCRELKFLSTLNVSDVKQLQRRIAGLTHHIRRAAEALLQQDNPMTVDVYNASWQSKQANKCVSTRATAEQTLHWFKLNATFGMVVPVYIEEMGVQHLELDSVDRIDKNEGKLHLNKNGWFQLSGESMSSTDTQHYKTQMLKPAKSVFVAACCGHRWSHKGKAQPYTLSLRELMLSTNINWKSFK